MEGKNLNAKVISIHEYKNSYNEVKNEVVEELEQVQEKLFTYSINLLISHKWKAWSDELPEGTEFRFEETAMRDAGDEFVNELLDLKGKIEVITKRNRQ